MIALFLKIRYSLFVVRYSPFAASHPRLAPKKPARTWGTRDTTLYAVFAAATTLSAASFMVSATTKFRPESCKIFLPS